MKEIKKKLFLSRPLPFKFFDLYAYIFFGKEEVPSSTLGIGSILFYSFLNLPQLPPPS